MGFSMTHNAGNPLKHLLCREEELASHWTTRYVIYGNTKATRVCCGLMPQNYWVIRDKATTFPNHIRAYSWSEAARVACYRRPQVLISDKSSANHSMRMWDHVTKIERYTIEILFQKRKLKRNMQFKRCTNTCVLPIMGASAVLRHHIFQYPFLK